MRYGEFMNVTLFVYPMCDYCIGIEDEVYRLAELYSLTVAVCLIKKNSKTGDVVAIDAVHNRISYSSIPGVPALLFGNKVFVGAGCCEALNEELKTLRGSNHC